jgi:hypothetical protein
VTVGGKALVPFNSEPGTPARAAFDAAILGMTPAQVGRFWVDRKVRGQAPPPRTLPSLAHVVKVVAKFPNAISYVPADKLTPELQAVAIDGVAHTDARYALRGPHVGSTVSPTKPCSSPAGSGRGSSTSRSMMRASA